MMRKVIFALAIGVANASPAFPQVDPYSPYLKEAEILLDLGRTRLTRAELCSASEAFVQGIELLSQAREQGLREQRWGWRLDHRKPILKEAKSAIAAGQCFEPLSRQIGQRLHEDIESFKLILNAFPATSADCAPLDRDRFQQKLDRHTSCLLARNLQALDEAPLVLVTDRGLLQHTYRFLLLRAFGDSPLVLRLNILTSGDGLLTVKSTDGSVTLDKYPPHVRERTVSVAKRDVDVLVASLDAAHFWTMSPNVVPVGARDGSFWMLEGQRGVSYHVALRWSPERSSFKDSALLLIKLSGEHVPNVD